jgi:integrase
MEIVEPIRKKTDLEDIKRILKKRSLRDYALFVLGINSGLRISDLLSLRVEDVLDPGSRRLKVTDRIRMREKKTGKVKNFPLNTPARSALSEYLNARRPAKEEPLFPSRKGKGPLTTRQAHRIISDAAKEVGIRERIGTHTMRKTFCYHAYKKGVDIGNLQKLLNHSSQTETLRYMGILRDDLDQIYEKLCL